MKPWLDDASSLADAVRRGEVKSTDAAGWPTTHGSLVFKDKVAEHDSTHVERLRAAGSVPAMRNPQGEERRGRAL